MITALDRPLRRTVQIGADTYVVTLEPRGLRVVRKGHRKGIEITWEQILAGEVALAAQLAGSLSASASRRVDDSN